MTWKSPKGELLYRIGDVMISTNSENPSAFFGGTWQLLCPGRTLVCVDTNDNDFNSVKKTGGEKTHVLTVAEMPLHTHTQNVHTHSVSISGGQHVHKGWYQSARNALGNGTGNMVDTNVTARVSQSGGTITSDSGAHSHNISVSSNMASNNNTGGGLAHNNLQPFMTVYIWVRIA